MWLKFPCRIFYPEYLVNIREIREAKLLCPIIKCSSEQNVKLKVTNMKGARVFKKQKSSRNE